MARRPLPPGLDQELFGADARSRSEPDRAWWIWPVYLLLFALSVPWYLPSSVTPSMWLGLPYWVVLSLGAALAAALFTLFVVRRHWSVDQPSINPQLREGPAARDRPPVDAATPGPTPTHYPT